MKRPTLKTAVELAASGTFRIKPLHWKKTLTNDRQSYHASVPFGSYYVERWREDVDGPFCGWHLSYHFKDYHDEDTHIPCASLSHGKALAWEDWVPRILQALTVVETVNKKC